MKSFFLKKVRWKGVIWIYYGQSTQVVCKAFYLMWKQYFFQKTIVAYGSARIVQTTAAVSFPKCRANYTKYDALMIPIMMQGVAFCLAKQDNVICKAIAVGLDAGVFLSYKAAYACIQLQRKVILLAIFETIVFGEPVFVSPSASEYDPLKYLKQSQILMSFVNTIPSLKFIMNSMNYQFEIARCRTVLSKALFVQNTPNERLIGLSKIVITDVSLSAFSKYPFGPNYLNGLAVYNVLNSLAF